MFCACLKSETVRRWAAKARPDSARAPIKSPKLARRSAICCTKLARSMSLAWPLVIFCWCSITDLSRSLTLVVMAMICSALCAWPILRAKTSAVSPWSPIRPARRFCSVMGNTPRRLASTSLSAGLNNSSVFVLASPCTPRLSSSGLMSWLPANGVGAGCTGVGAGCCIAAMTWACKPWGACAAIWGALSAG
ncbi:hypothetical protein D3C85_1123180 [compost metagenome]